MIHKTRFIIFLFVALLNYNYLLAQDTNCIRKCIPDYFNLNSNQLKLWRYDKNGCLGYRSNYLPEVLKNEKSIIGMPKRLFFVLFGNPDIENNDDDIYSYYSDAKCDKRKTHLVDSEFKVIVFRFVDGKLFSIDISVT